MAMFGRWDKLWLLQCFPGTAETCLPLVKTPPCSTTGPCSPSWWAASLRCPCSGLPRTSSPRSPCSGSTTSSTLALSTFSTGSSCPSLSSAFRLNPKKAPLRKSPFSSGRLWCWNQEDPEHQHRFPPNQNQLFLKETLRIRKKRPGQQRKPWRTTRNCCKPHEEGVMVYNISHLKQEWLKVGGAAKFQLQENSTHTNLGRLHICITLIPPPRTTTTYWVQWTCNAWRRPCMGVYRPLRPKRAISHLVTFQNMWFDW